MITIEKSWDENERSHEGRNGRIYESTRGRWIWSVVVDGAPESEHERRRDAKERADALTADRAAASAAASALGRLGGRTKSAARAAASRRNGTLGGRPRKAAAADLAASLVACTGAVSVTVRDGDVSATAKGGAL